MRLTSSLWSRGGCFDDFADDMTEAEVAEILETILSPDWPPDRTINPPFDEKMFQRWRSDQGRPDDTDTRWHFSILSL